jgi:hypothetical protein
MTTRVRQFAVENKLGKTLFLTCPRLFPVLRLEKTMTLIKMLLALLQTCSSRLIAIPEFLS